jgi:cell division protease FtsH
MGFFSSGRDYSEEAAQAIDAEVKRILEENYGRALDIIRDNHDRMVNLATKLMEVETLDRPMFEQLMNEILAETPTVIEQPVDSEPIEVA